MSDVTGFDFQMIIHVSAYEMREYKQCLMFETEVIFSLQNSDHIFTLLLTSATFKPVFCSAVPVGTAGRLGFSKDLQIILPFHSSFISWGPFFQFLNLELHVAFGLSHSNVLQSEAATNRVSWESIFHHPSSYYMDLTQAASFTAHWENGCERWDWLWCFLELCFLRTSWIVPVL